jgi:hypothetical protein
MASKTVSVSGPLEIPIYEGRAARTITKDNGREFFYVGRATRTFRKEAFTPDKLTKYAECLADYQKGTPVMFFVAMPVRRGRANATHISELEDFLIQTAVAVNPELLNIKGTREQEWGIAGVLRGGRGKASKSAQLFGQMMRLRPQSEPPSAKVSLATDASPASGSDGQATRRSRAS